MLEIPGHLDRRGQPCPRRRAESASQDHAGRRRGRRAPPGSPAGLYFSGLLGLALPAEGVAVTVAAGAFGWMLVQTYHVGVRPTVNQGQDEDSVQQAPALTIVRHRQAG